MIVLIGESASGKSTIEKELCNKGYERVISYTTRPKRPNEQYDVDYHYISEEEFLRLENIGYFAETTSYRGWHYGAAKKDCLDNKLIVVEPHGLRQLKQDKELNIISFYIKVSDNERLSRIAKRGDDIMECFRRVVSDQGVFQGIENEVDYVINGENTTENIIEEILDYIGKR